jgi:hypothetical protein
MRSRVQWILLLVLLVLATSAAAQNFTATLLGANEVPPCDGDGTGSATITFVGTTVNYTIVVNNITLPPTMQHIHVGAAGVNGPIVVNLPGTWVGNTLVGSTTAPLATIQAIQADPAGYYVNVHTTDCPGGAVRGQLAATAGTPTVSTLGLIALALMLAVAGIFVAKNV